MRPVKKKNLEVRQLILEELSKNASYKEIALIATAVLGTPFSKSAIASVIRKLRKDGSLKTEPDSAKKHHIKKQIAHSSRAITLPFIPARRS